MNVKIRFFKKPGFIVSVPKKGTIRDLQASILNYLQVPITMNNLNAIYLFLSGEMCMSSCKLSSLNITENAVLFCRIATNSLDKNAKEIFDENNDAISDNSQNVNGSSSNCLDFSNTNDDLDSECFNDSSGISNIPNRLYQSSRYISNDNYVDFDDLPDNPSDLCFFYATKDCFENRNQRKLPIFNDLILEKEDSNPKGHIKQLQRFEGAQSYSNRIKRAKSSFDFKQNSKLASSSFTSGENTSLKQNEPSCDSLPCCFPTFLPSSYSANGISFISNYENDNIRSNNDDNPDKNGDAQNTNDDNNNNDSNNNNNNILGLDFSIKTEDHKSNF